MARRRRAQKRQLPPPSSSNNFCSCGNCYPEKAEDDSVLFNCYSSKVAQDLGPPRDDPQVMERWRENWPFIQQIVQAIMKATDIKRSDWLKAIELIYSLCSDGPYIYSEEIYEHVCLEIIKSIENAYDEITAIPFSLQHKTTAYSRKWTIFSLAIGRLEQLFNWFTAKYIDTPNDFYGSAVDKHKADFVEFACYQFRQIIIFPLRDVLSEYLMQKIKDDRKSNNQLCPYMESIVLSFVTVCRHEKYEWERLDYFPIRVHQNPTKIDQYVIYRSIFENPFLKSVAEYYSTALPAIQTNERKTFTDKMVVLVRDELQRIDELVPLERRKYVKDETLKMMLDIAKDRLSEECYHFLKYRQRNNVDQLVRLLDQSTHGQKLLARLLEEKITAIGEEMIATITINDSAYPIRFMETVYQCYSTFYGYFNDGKNNRALYSKAFDDALTKLVNHKRPDQPTCHTSTYLVCYFHMLSTDPLNPVLRLYHPADESPEEMAKNMAMLCKYRPENENFQKLYIKYLAIRVLGGNYECAELERKMYEFLKPHNNNPEFTEGMDKIFKDIKDWATLKSSFQKEMSSQGISYPEAFTPIILNSNTWPICEISGPDLHLPEEFENAVTFFTTHYVRTYEARKLVWLHHLGRVRMNMYFDGVKYSAIMTASHAVILLLFDNGVTHLNYTDIKKRTNLSEDQMYVHLKSLTDARILLRASSACEPMDEDTQITKDDTFAINNKFRNKQSTFMLIPSKTGIPDRFRKQPKRAPEHLNARAQKNYMNCLIVRAMKARKTSINHELVDDMIKQASDRFTACPKLIKECLDELVEKDFLTQMVIDQEVEPPSEASKKGRKHKKPNEFQTERNGSIIYNYKP